MVLRICSYSSGEEYDDEVHLNGRSIVSESVTSSLSVPFQELPSVSIVTPQFGENTKKYCMFPSHRSHHVKMWHQLTAHWHKPGLQTANISFNIGTFKLFSIPAFVPPQSAYWPPSTAYVNPVHQWSTVITLHPCFYQLDPHCYTSQLHLLCHCIIKLPQGWLHLPKQIVHCRSQYS